jgi:polysaccharide export outer membrane protein
LVKQNYKKKLLKHPNSFIFAHMKRIIPILTIIVILSSCTSKKDYIYYQDIDEVYLEQLDKINNEFKIQVNDIIQVQVQTLDPLASLAFNKSMGAGGGGSSAAANQNIDLLGYIVDENGNIRLPFVGKINVLGLNLEDAESVVRSKLLSYLKNPYVSVRVLNYKFTVQGEVRAPGTFTTTDPNLTLLQALGQAGDLTINGRRHDVLIVRTIGNERVVKRIDLTTSEWMNTSYYFVQQNDLIYVAPNPAKVTSAGYIGNVGTLLSVVSIIFSTLVLIQNF